MSSLAADDTDQTYSVLQTSVAQTSSRISSVEDNFDLASVTPHIDGSVKHGSFFNEKNEDNSDSNVGYCLVGDKLFRSPSVGAGQVKTKQKRTTSVNQSSNVNKDDDTYCTFAPPGNSTTSLPDFSSNPLTSKSKYNYSNNNTTDKPTADNVYQIPPNSNFAEKRASRNSVPDFPPPSPASAETAIKDLIGSPADNIYVSPVSSNNNFDTKNRSQTLPVNFGMDYNDSYDNVNISNSPLNNNDNYDNVNITNKLTGSDVRLSGGDVRLSGGDVRLSGGDVRLSGGDVSTVEYYQSPPCTVFKDKPADLNLKQKQVEPQEYSQVKTKSFKQKRTATAIKREISLDSIDENKDNFDSKISETKKEPIDITENPDTKNTTQLNTASRIEEDTPIPMPRTKVKQNRTSVKLSYDELNKNQSDRSISSGYRMSKIKKNVPLNESYEWSKVSCVYTFCFVIE